LWRFDGRRLKGGQQLTTGDGQQLLTTLVAQGTPIDRVHGVLYRPFPGGAARASIPVIRDRRPT
jgi:hypothetical protein